MQSKNLIEDGPAQDWELYEKYRNGDLPSFHELFKRYKNRLVNLAYRFVKNREAAEDIAQDVLIKIYEKKVQFNSKAKFSTWAYRVTVNASLDTLRKKKFFGFSLNESRSDQNNSALPLSETLGDDKAPSILENLRAKEMEALVNEAVQNLPENLRIVITLFGFEEKSYQEIGEILGVSTKTVERRIYHAKEILRDRLAKNLL